MIPFGSQGSFGTSRTVYTRCGPVVAHVNAVTSRPPSLDTRHSQRWSALRTVRGIRVSTANSNHVDAPKENSTSRHSSPPSGELVPTDLADNRAEAMSGETLNFTFTVGVTPPA